MNRVFQIFVVLALLATAVPASAIDWSGRAGIWFDGTGALLGVGALVPFTDRIHFNPNIEAIFGADGKDLTVNADVLYDLTASPDTFLWVGGGAGVLVGDDTDLGINALAGYGLDRGAYVPFLQLKLFVGEDSGASLSVGLRF